MVAQIITIVNQSGKVIKSSKTLVNVFHEARAAYNEKKAELQTQRDYERGRVGSKSEKRTRRQLEALTLDDHVVSAPSSPRHSSDRSRIKRKPVATQLDRPSVERGITDSFFVNDDRALTLKDGAELGSKSQFTQHGRSSNDDPQLGELVRRHTDLAALTTTPRKRVTRSASLDDIDMDLAYGELPPPLPPRRGQDTVELRDKMKGLQRVLEECNCLQHSVTTIIENLSKNPDTMAAVALTLAEISNLATKLAPGALTAMKGSFPAVIALLASPEFAIAAGVGVGITIIAFGGYKIIKKIQARKDEQRLLAYGAEPESPTGSIDELREINRIESWRRGIADVEASSAGTSVDGEFITPIATRTLIEEGRLTEADLKSRVSSSHKGKKKKHRRGSITDAKSTGSKAKSTRGTRHKKEKPASGLRSIFSMS